MTEDEQHSVDETDRASGATDDNGLPRVAPRRSDRQTSGTTIANLVVFVALWAGTSSVAEGQVLFEDREVSSGWVLTQRILGNGGSQSLQSRTTGGNPGPYGRITSTVNNAPSGSTRSYAWGFFFRPDFVIAPSEVAGIASVSASEDVVMFSGFGGGQGKALALRQGGELYIGPLWLTNASTWQFQSGTNLQASDFRRFVPVPSTFWDADAHPNFSASGLPIEFGFLRYNSTGNGASGYSIIGGIDNFIVSVDVCLSFIRQPDSQSVCPVGLSTLEVEAASEGLPSFRWQYEGGAKEWQNVPTGPIPYEGGMITASDTDTSRLFLEFSTTATAPPIRFRCIVTNSCGSVTSEPATLVPCQSDLTCDNVVDDDDFVVFVAAYNLLDCADPAMVAGCPADLNGDGLVDDADFVELVAAYNNLGCL
ncbi:MAG: hypothetical protein JNM86_09290 [Phycisphaerae bacterium]|nr:hypothetical protein [Phycisphaerae bacterium]